MQEYFKKAIELARVGVKNKEGGPFGAVVVKDGEIIGLGNNKVLKENDPTSHAEIVAIRDACRRINSYNLEGAKIYSTSEPCPMCLSAIIWANIKEVYFVTTREEVGSIGFRDDLIYNYLEGKKKDILNLKKVENIACEKLLLDYKNTIY